MSKKKKGRCLLHERTALRMDGAVATAYMSRDVPDEDGPMDPRAEDPDDEGMPRVRRSQGDRYEE